MTLKSSTILAGALAAAFTVAFSGAGVKAQTAWDMPTPYGEGNFHTKNIAQFAEDISKATDGKLTVKIHSGGSLFKHPEIKNAVRNGQVPIGEFFLSRLANENALFQVDAIPFLASSYEEAEKLWAASRPGIEKLLEKQGLVALFSVPWPPQGFYTKRPINALSDMKGMKFRANNTATERLATLAGAVPTQIEVPDIPQAFATGRVEAMATSPSTGANTKSWDYVNHFYHTQAWLPKNIVVVNKKALRRLDDEQRAAVMAAAAAAEKRGWEASKAETDAKIAILQENGMKVENPSDTLTKELKEVGATMTEEWLKRAGEAGAAVLKAYKGG